ncbi:hypothetical protein AAGG74_16095 [Bacillus mexicanus]|uniref:hypothetical protein n=1 Tax=Bacillus mexicanus TaxID=2834415 RepID=UPI003D24E097
MNTMESIQVYKSDIFEFDISPFEIFQVLFLRSELEKQFTSMSEEEKIALLTADLKVIKNSKKIVEHIGKIYDFSESKHPTSEWWWHLDKVSRGEMVIKRYELVPAN